VTRHPARLVALAVVIAVGVGLAIAGLSQMGAVDVDDPRPSVPPEVTLAPLPTLSPSASATPSASPTATASPTPGADVWQYTIADGDSISGLAIRYGTTTEAILALNPEYEDNQDLVESGAQVIMPCTPLAVAEGLC
jgi:LysM repeat protein